MFGVDSATVKLRQRVLQLSEGFVDERIVGGQRQGHFEEQGVLLALVLGPSEVLWNLLKLLYRPVDELPDLQ